MRVQNSLLSKCNVHDVIHALYSDVKTIKCSLFFIIFVLLQGCSSLPKPEYSQVVYDYQIKPPYEMSEAYRYLNVTLDAKDVNLPEKKFKDESFKFAWSSTDKRAQFAVYINLSNSYLIDRENTVKDELEYDKDGKGVFTRRAIQRGYIRTRYTVELVDRMKDKLMHSVNLAGNYAIEAELTNSKLDNKKILKSAYYQNLNQAREQLLVDIWQDLKKYHLSDIQTTFGKVEDKVVSKLSVEPKFEQAYLLLKTNKKRNAVKALSIYNNGVAYYKDKDDSLSIMILKHLDHGITVSAKIANHEYPDRY